MYISTTLAMFGLVAGAFAAPVDTVEELHIVRIDKRQADISQLLQLATLAGITDFPTDPAFLLSLGPEATSLAAALPTPSVLSVLVTAAPSGFVSNIVNDPSYAAAFESSFSAGSSPSWFNALPTGVKSYLHSYTGFGNVAGAAAGFKGSASNATSSASGSSGSGSMMTTTSSGSSSTGSSMMSSSMTSSMSSGASSAGAGTASSSSSKAGAAKPTGVVAAGILGAVGFLGVAVAL